jgi:hypothetical protein
MHIHTHVVSLGFFCLSMRIRLVVWTQRLRKICWGYEKKSEIESDRKFSFSDDLGYSETNAVTASISSQAL